MPHTREVLYKGTVSETSSEPTYSNWWQLPIYNDMPLNP